MKDSTFQKICMVLAVAFLLAMIISTIWRFLPTDASSLKKLSPGLAVTTMVYYTMLPITIFVQLGISVWLFKRNKGTYPWLWFLLGIVLGVLALIVNLLLEISAKLDRHQP